MTGAARICTAVLLTFGTIVALSACASKPVEGETSLTAQPTQAAPHPEQALLEDLVLANRMLARELAILDIQGHATVRSRMNPNHYYIARFLSPGGVSTSDIIENDLDSKPVAGPRNDQAREIYLHGEIYKARPDVMAIIHAHTPEFVAFGMSSVPLWHAGSVLPVWDIRPFNNGRSGIVSTPALGKAMAEKLGRSEAVLLWGHGIAVTGSSLADVVSRADDLRNSARMQEAVISMGGTWKSSANPGVDEDVANRTWEYLKKMELRDMGGRVATSPEPAPAKPTDPDAATAHDLVLASRILASEELGVLDRSGHVSIRNPRNPTSYFVAPGAAAAAVTARDVVQRDVNKPGNDSHGGLSIDDEIYKARPDVMAVLYARTPEVVAFSEGSPPLRPVVNGGAFIGEGLPVFSVGSLDAREPILSNPTLGRGVAMALTKKPAVLLSGHGFVLAARSVYNLVDQAYQMRMNATIQQQAMALRGKVARLDERIPGTAPSNPPQPPQADQPQQPAAQLGPPEGRAWIYWSQNVSVDR